ncbi:putative alpha,alpha-trehalose-phosphate synthase [Microlunatus endophyticus]|uniref:Alpha,alpha-trehalose-phosphate synthase n=1 Tax=Microlunatus endophyticus TaxID=1716077 RepID=A0A917SI22_9ACTN|nr:trehalose-6-phosphate synthase [Microlunatus endophyticus]GGL82164.1 putative alpha,alpha-trehalose-phosphate synthase [Microlunatus endophyticus]
MGPAPRSKSTKPTEATDASSRNGKKSATAAATRKHSAGHPASFVVVANRLPVDRVTNPDGSSDWRSSPGGLVTALEPVLKSQGGAWIGWTGAADEDLDPFDHDGIEIVPVALSGQEIREYYEGFSNATLWPLYHDVVAHPEFHREWWDAYRKVNRRFAERAAEVAENGAIVWVQDYQLQLVPEILRELRPDLRIGFFLHIPFPPTELFQQLPWRREIIEGLLGADLVGFQTTGGAQNFSRLVRQRAHHPTQRGNIELPDGRRVLTRAYPISIQTREFYELAKDPKTKARAEEIRHDVGDPKHLFLGVDRLDYTKGIYQRLRAFGELISDGALDPAEAVFVQVANPSRERVEEYKKLRDDIERLVGRLNGEIGGLGRPVINYMHTSYGREDMAALYRAADVMVVTPLRDGMNLVAKEYIACRQDDDGALILSEFAGAARELRQAYMINPYDINQMKERMLEAATDSPRNKARRMRILRRQVFDHDIDRWAGNFLDDLNHFARSK